jgi:hypothetical protein
MEPEVKKQIIDMALEMAVDGELACADAHRIAAKLDLSALEVSRVINRSTNLRFFRCQLGLFGYGPKLEGKSKIVHSAERVPSEIEQDLSSKALDGAISCADVWAIAEAHKYPRLQMGNIAEALQLRVRPCQLGCF